MGTSGGSSNPSGAAGGVLSGTYPNPGTAQQATVNAVLASPLAVSATTATPVAGLALSLGVGKWLVVGTVTVDSAPGANAEVSLVVGTATATILGGGGDTAAGAGLTSGRSIPVSAYVTVTVAGTVEPSVYCTAASNVVSVGPVNNAPGVSNLTAVNLLA